MSPFIAQSVFFLLEKIRVNDFVLLSKRIFLLFQQRFFVFMILVFGGQRMILQRRCSNERNYFGGR